jgi:hypothetical protein
VEPFHFTQFDRKTTPEVAGEALPNGALILNNIYVSAFKTGQIPS